MKKKILTTLSVVLILGLAALGILAYLQDEDSDVNVMTLGNVDIEQIEQERADNGTLQDFTGNNGEPGKPAFPAVGPIEWADEGVDVNGTEYKVFTDDLKNVVDKIVTVKNTGKSDAYVRTIIAIEAPDYDPNDLIHVNVNTSGVSNTPWAPVDIDGVKYVYSVFTYEDALKPNEISAPSLMQVFLDSKANNDDVAKFGENWEIMVFSQAVQAKGFEDKGATYALNEAFGEITASNHPWVNAVFSAEKALKKNGNTYSMDGDAILTDESLFSDHTATEPYTVDGNGATVTGIATSVDAFQWEGGTIPAMSPIFSSKDGSKVTVKDITFTGTMSAVMAGHYVNSSSNWYNTEFNKVNIVDAEVVSFSAGISPALAVYGTLVMNNCNVYGTKLSSLDTDPMWPVYDMAVVNYSDTTINNSKIGSIYMWNQAKVTVADGTTVDSILVAGNMNTAKYGLTVKAGANVGAIDLTKITDVNRINITIEDGATLGGFVDNDVKYSTLDAWKAAQ